jgi:hypothetical protein
MKSCKDLQEPLCETDERGERIFTKNELNQVSIEINQRILEVFYFAGDREIAFLLQTHISKIKSFTERGEFPSTEILLLINKVTGVSIDWLLTGIGAKFSDSAKIPIAPPSRTFNSIVSAQTF